MQISSRFISSGIVLLFLLLTAGIGSADEVNIEMIGYFHNSDGWTYAVEFSENYAYITEGQEFVVLDVSDPSSPLEISRYNLSEGPTDTWLYGATDIYLSGNHAYLTRGPKGMVIFDISDPNLPVIAGNYDPGTYCARVVVKDTYAYIANVDTGLLIVDVSDPASPFLVGSYTDYSSAYSVVVDDYYAYVAAYNYGLLVIDISDPTSPTLVGNYYTETADRIAVNGNYVYLADDWNTFFIFDVSDPSDPILTSTFNTPVGSLNIAASGDFVYFADGVSGLLVLDVSNPYNPLVAGIYDTMRATDLAIDGSYVYLADRENGLIILYVETVTTPLGPVTNLQETGVGSNWITWTWENPYNSDLSHVMVYIDGAFITNTSDWYYTSMGLTEGVHTISTKTVDNAGNINPTWVNDSARTATVDVDLVSQFGGQILDVAVAGDYAYIGQGKDLVVLDIANVNKLSEVGRVIISSEVTGVAVEGDHAYVISRTDYSSSLDIVDITDPSAPSLVGSYYTAGYAYGVDVEGNYAYVIYWNGFEIVDISDPSAPTLVGNYETFGDAWDITVEDNYAYLTSYLFLSDDFLGKLEIVNISDPSAPTLVGSYDTAGYAYGVAVAGNYAYIGDDSGVSILDISNPSVPVLVGSTDVYAYDVAVAGNYAYISGENRVSIVDISDPSAPTLTGFYDTASYACEIAVAGNYAFVADGSSGLVIVDISDPSAPTSVSTYGTFDYAYGVAVSGNYAYVTAYNGLAIVDISSPSAPTLVGSYYTAGDAYDVDVEGNYAYVINWNGLEVVDISDPAVPTFVGNYETFGDPYDVAVAGNYAYVTAYDCLVIVDISNPYSPTLAGSYDTAGNAYGVAVSGNYAYVADDWNGLVIVDISDPSAPALAGRYDTTGYVYGVSLSSNYAYLTAYNGLEIVDITDVSSPALVGSYDTAWYASDVAVSGNYAYVAADGSGLMIVDISDPSAPALAGSCGTGGYASGVAVAGNYIYVADIYDGFVVLRVGAPGPVDTPPVAEAGPDQVVTTDAVVTFNGNGSTDDKGITTYSWDFDAEDGITTDATGVTATTSYATAGNYTVTLTVTDTAGQTDSDTLQVTVSSPTTTVTLTPDYDNRLRQSSPNTVYSSTNYLDIGRLGTTSYRDVMWFDLSGYTPSDTISKATLSLCWYYPSTARNSDTTVEIYRPAAGWNSNYVTWNSRISGIRWNTPGGDWVDKNGVLQGATPYASVTFPAGKVPDNNYYEFDVTQLVQEYVSNPDPNANTGFFLKAKTEGNNYIAFYSSDWPNADQRPELTITTTSGTTPTDNPPVAEAGPDQLAATDAVVTFNGSASTDDKDIVSYSWDFDASNGVTTDATGMTTTTSYSTAGNYTVTLTVIDSAGQTDSDTLQVVVTSQATTITVSYTPDYDNRLRQASPNTVYSSTNYLDIGRLGTTSYRDVMWFDLSGYTPSDTISKATLSLCWYYPPGATRTSDTIVEVYKPEQWHPQYVTWNSRMSGMLWNTAGGNWFDKNGVPQGTTPYASVTFLAGTVPDNKYYEFDVTQLVQEYVSGTTNTGFFLKAKTEGNNYIAFYSSDWPNADQRPKLNVTSS